MAETGIVGAGACRAGHARYAPSVTNAIAASAIAPLRSRSRSMSTDAMSAPIAATTNVTSGEPPNAPSAANGPSTCDAPICANGFPITPTDRSHSKTVKAAAAASGPRTPGTRANASDDTTAASAKLGAHNSAGPKTVMKPNAPTSEAAVTPNHEYISAKYSIPLRNPIQSAVRAGLPNHDQKSPASAKGAIHARPSFGKAEVSATAEAAATSNVPVRVEVRMLRRTGLALSLVAIMLSACGRQVTFPKTAGGGTIPSGTM